MTPTQQLNTILTNIDPIIDQYSLYQKPISVHTEISLNYEGFALTMTDQGYEFTYGRQTPNAIALPTVDPRHSPQNFKQELTTAIKQLQTNFQKAGD